MNGLIAAPVTDAQFLMVFNRLCVALREPQDDTGITQGVYFDALRDLPFWALEEGATALSRQTGRRFFPTTAEWRTASTDAQRDAQRKEYASVGRIEAWKHECLYCEDTGFVLGLNCDGSNQCGRTKKHAAHTFTKFCVCRPTNRTYARHHSGVV